MEDWRRIDIDAYDPDRGLTEEDLRPAAAPVTSQEVSTKAQQVRTLSGRGSFGDSLAYALTDPPYGADEGSKALYLSSVLEALQGVKQSEIPEVVKSLDRDQQDALIKVIYRGMETKDGQKQGGLLLSWFDKTIEVTGNGPIVRYMSDKRVL
ncbi:unnamed protein product [Kuraishia capsulata CBS 1993]|uniref:Actin-related protein 2/3 complex subunit 5 n=1 Tax=Kuraishia capsulata CBS 1993 TaxID=1382522 RepID=W6MI89_9ASCO|nr:uncharacterized protein KUCA_T00001822001 [Kuraishia capsulata CBS 1993]CDK25851.1 unnamed protein product [Kuraishia capsulata CBS 1993]